MLLSVRGAGSSPGFPGTVTRPRLNGCPDWRWLPRVRRSRHPSRSRMTMTSRTSMTLNYTALRVEGEQMIDRKRIAW